MIYAGIKPIEAYDVTLASGYTFGLHDSYIHQPTVLALIMLATPFPYDYEGTVPPEQRRVSLKDVSCVEDSLTYQIRGQLLNDIMLSKNPIEISKMFKEEDISDMPMVRGLMGGNVSAFRAIVGARSAAWALSYRGEVSATGKVMKVSFGGGSKSVFDIPPEDLAVHNVLQGRSNDGQKV